MIDIIPAPVKFKDVKKLVDKNTVRRFIKGAVAGMTLGALLGSILIVLGIATPENAQLLAIPAILAAIWGLWRVIRWSDYPIRRDPPTSQHP